MRKLEQLVRPHILRLKPYSSARDEFSGKIGIFLDANENAFGSTTKKLFNRYPDPYQQSLKLQLSTIKKVKADKIFLGNGSDEPIDLIIRLFCSPGKDNIIVIPPTYEMYEVAATINDNEVIKVPLTNKFNLDIDSILNSINANTKLIFICSPNNPTGNRFPESEIFRILKNFEGFVVLDEAYIDFSVKDSLVDRINDYPNLVVLQTLSKAWGLAGLRLGMAFAIPELIFLLNKIKSPYNINEVTQKLVSEALSKPERKNDMVGKILKQRKWLEHELGKITCVEKIFPSDTNFLLVRFSGANAIFEYLLEKGVIVRNRSRMIHCENTLRITAGTENENKKLISCLQTYCKEL